MDLKSLYKLSYGVYVIGACKGDKLNAQIANTVFQITAEPPAVAVSINKGNLTHEYIKASRVFTVSVLGQAAPLPFIGGFGFKSGRDVDKLANVKYIIGETGAPVITEHATAYLEAEVTRDVDAGTHTVFIGRVVAAEVLTDDAVMTYDYYHQIKRGTTPKTAPVYIDKEDGGKNNG